MNDPPLISIVIVNYNGLAYLKKTIPPILQLDYPRYEAIVVDNGSTDGSIEFIKKTEGISLLQSPRLREKNFACNYGITHAAGDYVLLLDNDVVINEKKILNNLYTFYKSSDNVGCIGLAAYNEGDVCSKNYGSFLGYCFIKEKSCLRFSKIKELHGIEIGFPAGIAIFISSDIWKHVGGYDEHLIFGGDDNDLGIKLSLMGYKNYLYSNSIQIHIGMPERGNNTKYALKWKEMFYAHLYTIAKNYSFHAMLVTLFLYSFFGFFKSVKQSLFRHDVHPFLSFFSGYYIFLINLPTAIEKRKEIQSKRIVKFDRFLKIKPPEV